MLKDFLSSSGHTQVDKNDSKEINIKNCNGDEDK